MTKSPVFQVRKKLFSNVFHVVMVRGFFRSTKVARFKSESDAKYWISHRSLAWLEKRKPAPETQA